MRRFILLLPVLLCSLIFPAAAQDATQASADSTTLQAAFSPPPEAPAELVNISLDDTDVELLLKGRWRIRLEAAVAAALLPSFNFSNSENPLLFTQEVDLMMQLRIKETWFVEASFLDNYELNTWAAGYRGKENDTVRYLGIGNRGLNFPDFPFMQIGGDAPNSFGIYGEFGEGDLRLHSLLRYDAAKLQEKVFVGSRERSISNLGPENWIGGRFFVLPDAGLSSYPELYLEDEEGNYTGSDGRTYRKAAAGDYSASLLYGLVELKKAHSGRIAVSYTRNADTQPWNSSLGDWTAPGFLADAQDAFPDLDISTLPQPGGGTSPLSFTINSVPALLIYESGTFSVFEQANRYQSPVQTTASTEADCVRRSNGALLDTYTLSLRAQSTLSSQDSNQTKLSSTISEYELKLSTSSLDTRNPLQRWPLSLEDPRIYLPSREEAQADIQLRFISYGAESSYQIGTDTVPSSVQVSRDGVPDSFAVYDQDSGKVQLSSPARQDEIIRITWLKRQDERRFGSLAGGFGAVWSPEKPFALRAGAGFRWTIAEEAFSSPEQSNYGMLGLSAAADWKTETLKASLSGGLRYEQFDTSSLYRITGMEGQLTRLSLTANEPSPADSPSMDLNNEDRAPLIYRNYQSSDWLGNTYYKDISAPNINEDPSRDGPYLVGDSSIPGYPLVLEYNLQTDQWSGFQVELGSAAQVLSRSQSLLLPLYFATAPSGTVSISLQIGELSNSEELLLEAPHLVWTVNLDTELASAPSSWTAVRILLDDEARAQLSSARALRVWIENTALTAEASGKLVLGQIIPEGARFAETGATVWSREERDPTLAASFPSLIQKLESNDEYPAILRFAWDDSATDQSAGVYAWTEQIPLERYTSLSFFIKAHQSFSAGETLSFALASNSEQSNPVLLAVLPASALSADTWHKISINLDSANPQLMLDDSVLSSASLSYHPERNAEIAENACISLSLKPASESSLSAGSLSLDELILQDSPGDLVAALGGAVDYQKKGILWELGSVPIIQNLSASTRLDGSVAASADQNISQKKGLLGSRSSLSVDILGAKLEGDIILHLLETQLNWIGRHGLTLPLGPLSIKDNWSLNGDTLEQRHILSLLLKSPVNMKLTAENNALDSKEDRAWAAQVQGEIPLPETKAEEKQSIKLSTEGTLAYTQNAFPVNRTGNYATDWIESSIRLLPDDGSGSTIRNLSAKAEILVNTLPLGLKLAADLHSKSSNAIPLRESKLNMLLSLPWTWKKNTLTLQTSRTILGKSDALFVNSLEDLDQLAVFLGSSSSLWADWPVYSFFNPLAATYTQSLAEDIQHFSYIDKVEASARIPQRIGISGLWIPSSAGVSFWRENARALQKVQDSHNLEAKLSFSALNLFGAFGSDSLFSFYRDDEFIHTISGKMTLAQIGLEDNFEISASQQILLTAFKGSSLSCSHNATIATDSWKERIRLDWLRRVESSFLPSLFFKLVNLLPETGWSPFIQELQNSKNLQDYTESLEFSLNSTTEGLDWQIGLIHSNTLKIQNRMNLSGFIKLSLSRSEKAESMELGASSGISLSLQF